MNRIKSFHWTEKMELVNLSAMLILLPVDSGVSLFFSILWMFTVVLKNTILKRWSFFGWHQDKSYHYSKNYYFLIPMMCYWFVYLLSIFWTENQTVGWVEIGQLAWFVILPLTCVCTDFRQISQQMLRKLLWLYVLVMSSLFVVLLTIVIVKACCSVNHGFWWYMMNEEFYRIHRIYMSLYILTGLIFLYTECNRPLKGNIMHYLCVGICALCLVLFLISINSRAGLLSLIVLMMLCWLHQFFLKKRYRFSLWSLVLIALLVVGTHYALPGYFYRLSSTIEQLAHGTYSDDGRIQIMENAWSVVKDNMLLGVGAGDRMDELVPYYGSLEDVYNPHNQYLDTWMTTGMAGLLTLLAMIVIPLVLAWKKRLVFPFLVVFIIGVNLLFESMLERQMGVVFIGVIYIYIVLFFQFESEETITT